MRVSIPKIPKLATGTNYIPKEGIYHLHEGESVVPKKYNPNANGGNNTNTTAQISVTNEMKVNGKVFAKEIIPDLNTELKRLGYQGLYVRG